MMAAAKDREDLKDMAVATAIMPECTRKSSLEMLLNNTANGNELKLRSLYH